MFQLSVVNILSRFNTKSVEKSEVSRFDIESTEESRSSNYNWKTLTKAGLVFVTTTGAFLTLKTAGSFNLIASWWKNSSSKTNLGESSALANFNNPSTQTYIAPTNKEQPLTHQYAKREPAVNEALIKIGPEFQVNTYTTDSQWSPSMAGLSDGKFVVTWGDLAQDGSLTGIYGQMFNANGIKYGSEFQVNTYTINYQSAPMIEGLSDSKFVVTWSSNGQDGDGWGVYVQMFYANGTKYSSEFRVNTYVVSHQSFPPSTRLNDGKFVVTWHSNGQDGSDCGVYGQIFNANGTKFLSEFQVSTYTAFDQSYATVTVLNDGKFVVTWMSYGQDGDDYGIYYQMFNANGTKFLSESQVNMYTTYSQEYPSITSLSNGKFIITWSSFGQDKSYYGVYGQIFNTDGNRNSNEFQINTYTVGDQKSPSVASLNDSKFVVTWRSNGQDGSGDGIYGQMFSSNGSKYGSEFQVNTYTTSNSHFDQF